MNKTTITLHYPVDVDGVKIETLEYVRPTGEDLLKVEGQTTSPLEADFILYAQQCSVPLSLIKKLDATDIEQLHKEYARIPAPLSDISTPEQLEN